MLVMSFLGNLENTAAIFWLNLLDEAGFENETEVIGSVLSVINTRQTS